ncbi:hypothetical protein BJ973_000352 [Actinoplanes tereljensis]|uniref:Uncharacterized protein n=1 Tax=Paractinoplanes tereljensis TaxID=571912 RepID=A0A919NSM6_9ACTN|nr:hypothetical protein [Actinoplanes tereljensis]GIF23291.1 hypothetical protein Ate02nite_60210 [Actinoplanes tereljensis]
MPIHDNVDAFTVHPVYALVAALPDRETVDAVLGAIDSGETVELLHGPVGLKILDQRGSGHGLSARLHRLLQNWTYYEQILGSFAEALRAGDFLLLVPCPPEDRHRIGRLLATGGGHAAYYFGYNTVESITRP